jgi:hypothetical protein
MSIGQANDRAGGGDSSTGSSGMGDEGGRQRDEGYVTQLRSGDEGAFGLLYDAWADPVYDRISNRGYATSEACRIESDTFATVHRRMAQQTAQQPGSDSFRVMAMRAARQEVAASATNRVDTSLPVGPYAEDRLTRGTDIRALASDPAVAALLWQAAELLGEQVREVLDLTHRHHLTSAEAAAVLQEPTGAIEEILRKVAAGYGAVVRARIVWRQGAPTHDALREQVAGEPRFDASMVRRVAEHLRECDECRSASQVPVPPIEVFAAIPIAVAPDGFKEEVVAALEAGGVVMVGSVSARHTGNGDYPDFGENDDFPDFDEPDDARVDRAAIAAALAASGIDEADTLASRTSGGPTTTTPPVAEEAPDEEDITEAAPVAERPSHPGVVVGGAAAGAAALGLAAGLGELPAEAVTTAPPTGPMLPGGLGPMPPAPDFGPDVAPRPKAPVPSTLIAASMRKGGGGPPSSQNTNASRNRWILVAVATVAVIALLAYMLTRTGDNKKAALNTVNQTTTTEATTTTGAPTTSLGTVTTLRHRPPPRRVTTTTQTTVRGVTTTTQRRVVTPTTQAVTTTTSPYFPGLQHNLTISSTGFNVPHGWWTLSDPTAPNLTWSASADVPISVLISGPGFSSTVASGSSAGLCPTGVVNAQNRCVVTTNPPAPGWVGSWQYTLKVTDQHGHTISQTIVLTVNAPIGP